MLIKAFDAINVSTSHTSNEVDLNVIDMWGAQYSWSSGVLGEVIAEVSIDGANWVNVPNAGSSGTSFDGSGPDAFTEPTTTRSGYQKLRFRYVTDTGSAGALSVYVSGKERKGAAMVEKPVNGTSTGASFTGAEVELPASIDAWGFQATWTGTTTGTIKMQGTIDGTNWEDVTGFSDTPSGSPGSTLKNTATFTHYVRVRPVYTRTSGTGAMSVWVSAKERHLS